MTSSFVGFALILIYYPSGRDKGPEQPPSVQPNRAREKPEQMEMALMNRSYLTYCGIFNVSPFLKPRILRPQWSSIR